MQKSNIFVDYPIMTIYYDDAGNLVDKSKMRASVGIYITETDKNAF